MNELDLKFRIVFLTTELNVMPISKMKSKFNIISCILLSIVWGNTMAAGYAYDKAEWHSGGDYPHDLPQNAAYTHIGMYLGWLIETNLVSKEFINETQAEIQKFKSKRTTGAKVLGSWDGTLIDDMLSKEGNAFSKFYYVSKPSLYFEDYANILVRNLPTVYHVTDSWENYEKLKKIITKKYKLWKLK